jgi:FlaG/FlaF family flagellin (archaellin)
MRQNAAVSPVIGAILMLVLTIIIAAIASSFAGGLMETKSKPPAVTLEAEYFISGNLSLVHIAGEPIPLSQISLRLTPSQTFGIDAARHSRTIDKTMFQNEKGFWDEEITVMQVGERHWISSTDIATALDSSESDPKYRVKSDDSVGKTFYLEVYYDRTLIAKLEVLIRA